MKKVLVIAAADNTNFIRDIGDALKGDFDLKFFNAHKIFRESYGNDDLVWQEVKRLISEQDVVWLEWADGICLQLLAHQGKRRKIFENTKLILRIHRYELFKEHLINNHIPMIQPSDLNALVFVSEYVRGIFEEKFPSTADFLKDKTHVIPNLIDIDKFPFYDKRENGHNLLLLGRMSYVKNLPLMLTMFHELLRLDGNYVLNIVGEITDPELHYYLDNFIDKLKIRKNVRAGGHIPNEKLPEFMKTMNYICCSSIFESQGVGILEAMATGLKPVIFNFPGAENFFPEKWLYIDRSQFVMRVLEPDYDPALYRQFVLDRYSIQKNIWKYRDLINDVLKGD